MPHGPQTLKTVDMGCMTDWEFWSEPQLGQHRLVALLMQELVLAVHTDCAAAPKQASSGTKHRLDSRNTTNTVQQTL